MRKRFKVVFIVNALAAVRALQLIDPNLLPYDYPEWTEVRGYPAPLLCSSDDDCLKGKARCIRGECHCDNPIAFGDGKKCYTKWFAKCKWDLQKHCESSPLYHNSHCIWNPRFGIEILLCKCNKGHYGRAGYIGCVKAEDDPDGKRTCLGDKYCPPLSFCNSKTRRCQCKQGLTGNGVKCRPLPGRVPCKSDNDCQRFAYCKDATCHCKYELIGDGKTCNRAPRKKCRSKQDCHAFANCMNGYCVCKDGPGNGEFCRTRFDICYPKNPCGWNNGCRKDRLTGDLWCICKIGVDNNGNCVECFNDQHCAEHKAKCVNHKCECRDELYRSHGRCTNYNVQPQKCKQDKNCHPDAKCEDGKCVCQGKRLGNGLHCRTALDCPKGFEDSCGSRGVCLKDPYMTHIRDCKCFRGHYFDLPPGYCIECQSNKECPISASCRRFYCVCKDELIKKGFTKTCMPGPVHKCKVQSDCHAKAKCFLGKCVCQNMFTGNGKFCREALSCSKKQLEQCGEHATCIADPYLPDHPVCRCVKGFKVSKENKCADIDECQTLRATCKSNRCQNTVGSYYCTKCPEGYTEGHSGSCIAVDQCDCGENEECYDGECYCAEGYERDQFGQCFWPEGDLLLDDATPTQDLSYQSLLLFGLFGFQALSV